MSEQVVQDIWTRIEGLDEGNIWPGFEFKSSIPLLIVDEGNSYFFNHPNHAAILPNNFFCVPGKHPEAILTSAFEIDGAITAIVPLEFHEGQDAMRIAAQAVHEMFHVHQQVSRKEWAECTFEFLKHDLRYLQCDSDRLLEQQLWRNAVRLMGSDEGAARVECATALSVRRNRLAARPEVLQVERNSERSEGIPFHIECTVQGYGPGLKVFRDSTRPEQFRRSCYIAGLLLCRLLDGLVPDWRAVLDSRPELYLDEVLAHTLEAANVTAREVSIQERTLAEKRRVRFAQRLASMSEGYLHSRGKWDLHLVFAEDKDETELLIDPMQVVWFDDFYYSFHFTKADGPWGNLLTRSFTRLIRRPKSDKAFSKVIVGSAEKPNLKQFNGRCFLTAPEFDCNCPIENVEIREDQRLIIIRT